MNKNPHAGSTFDSWLEEEGLLMKFTPEQTDWICEKIGDWYLMMKPLLEGQHNLGHMKEKLKTMICPAVPDELEYCHMCAQHFPYDNIHNICTKCAVKAVRYEWSDVMEDLPEHGQMVLAMNKDKHMAVLRFDGHPEKSYLFMWPDLTFQVINITHWMPLPEYPNE